MEMINSISYFSLTIVDKVFDIVKFFKVRQVASFDLKFAAIGLGCSLLGTNLKSQDLSKRPTLPEIILVSIA